MQVLLYLWGGTIAILLMLVTMIGRLDYVTRIVASALSLVFWMVFAFGSTSVSYLCRTGCSSAWTSMSAQPYAYVGMAASVVMAVVTLRLGVNALGGGTG